MRINSFFAKLLLVFIVLLMTYFYAQYERAKYYSTDSADNELILKLLPNFNTTELSSAKKVSSLSLLRDSNGLFVHLWGSWCGPCEHEMPAFLKYAESVQGKKIKFLLVAINDEEIKVKKFMSRFTIPSNVTITLDKENVTMDLFGTRKVPESFLFNSAGKHVSKFIGPQEWTPGTDQWRQDFGLNIHNSAEHKIETH